MARDRTRRVEGSLLFFVLLIVLSGLTLVFLAKSRVGVPPDHVNLNMATRDEIALAFEIDPALAALIVQKRDKRGGFRQVHDAASVSVFGSREVEDAARAALMSSHLDVNTAGLLELEKVLNLPRPVARRVLDYRAGLPEGKFRQPDDLLHTPVVSEAALQVLGDRLIVRQPMQVFTNLIALLIGASLLIVFLPALVRKAGIGGDPFLLPISLLLCGFGVIALFTLRDPFREAPIYLDHVKGTLLGMAALLAGILMPARSGQLRGRFAGWIPARHNLRHYSYLWAILSMLLTIALRFFGSGPEGVRISLFGIQPVEIIKILMVLFVASYLSERGDLLADALHRWRQPTLRGRFAALKQFGTLRWEDAGPMLGIYGAALLLFLIVRDMGPALVMFGAFLSTFYLATGRGAMVWAGCLLIVVGIWAAYALHIGVVPVRVEMWRAPWANPHPNGMQLGQSLWGMASGGLWGSGLGLGDPRLIARSDNDLIFATLSEELGLIGSLFLLVMYVVIVWRGLRIAQAAQNDFDRLLAAGLTSLFACQTFLILGGVTGLVPLSGITLPFIAKGNSALLATLFVIGLLRGISAPTGSVPVGAPKPLFTRTTRRYLTAIGIGILGFIGAGRLFWVQALASDDIAGRSIRTPDADKVVRGKINPRLAALARAIPRGSIYDRNGAVLATSRLDEISRSVEDTRKAQQIFRRGRYYPRGAECVHIVGYLDPALGGPVGFEKEYDTPLRGFTSYSELLGEYRGKDLPLWLFGRPARRGADVTCSLDAEWQHTAYAALTQAVGEQRDTRNGRRRQAGAFVLLDPQRGETLVSVTLPSYDPNTLTPASFRELQENADKSFRLVDRARTGVYPPGSTLKVATAAAGLDAGLDPEYDCNHVAKDLRWNYDGAYYARRQIQDDKGDSPHNRIHMARAMRVSCNLYFIQLGLTLGAERLHRMYTEGFQLEHIKPLPAFAADLAENAFGQGTMRVTPTEMARCAATIANQGRMMKPILAQGIRAADAKQITPTPPVLMGEPLLEENARKIGEMMRGVVTEGTAKGVFDALPVEVAGKTGTAQTDTGDGEPHSWFIGFAPFSRPQYAFSCVIENGGYGKRGAAPVVREVLSVLFRR